MASPADRSNRRTIYGYTRPGFGGHGLPGHTLVKRMLTGGWAVALGIALSPAGRNDPVASRERAAPGAAAADLGLHSRCKGASHSGPPARLTTPWA